MQLTNYTDYGLRTLIALAVHTPRKLQLREIADSYRISVHHLTKVVQRLAALGYVQTSRGKSGGVLLSRDPATIRIGTVVRQLEQLGLVECLRADESNCTIAPSCRLKTLLNRELQRFIDALDEHTLADLVAPKRELRGLLQLRRAQGSDTRPHHEKRARVSVDPK